MYLKNNDCYMPFGEPMTSDVDPETDIDVFLVDKRFHSRIYEAHERVDIFSGTVQDLYCKPVYSVSGNNIYSANKETQSTLWRNSLGNGSVKVGDLQLKYSGRIAPAEVHRKLELPEHVFLVDCAPCSNFAPGDSGTMVALKTAGEGVMLVGIIAGEYMYMYMNRPDESAATNTKYISCVLLPYGLQCIRAKYGIELTVYQSNKTASEAVTACHSSTIARAKANRKQQKYCVFPGHIIWVKTPECIKPTDFVLIDHLIILMNADLDNNMDPEELAMELAFQRLLQIDVHSGEAKSYDMYQHPIQQYFLQCMMGIYQRGSRGDYISAEKYFKNASRLIIRTGYRKQALSQFVTYVLMQLSGNEQPQERGKFLEASEKFMREMQQGGFCPAISVALFYNQYASYYLDDQPAMATKMALESFHYTRLHDIDKDSEYECVGVNLALVLVARFNLGCGEYFEERNTPIDAENIQNAEYCLQKLEGNMLDVVLTIIKCDLEYRRGNVANALELARECQQAASRRDLEHIVDLSTIRVDALTQILA